MFDDGWYASETVPGNWQKQYSEKFHHLYLPDSVRNRNVSHRPRDPSFCNSTHLLLNIVIHKYRSISASMIS
jgi:hypothetical protein